MILGSLNVKEIAEHRHQQRLAKSPRPRKERDRRRLVQESPDNRRLVDKIIAPPYLGKIISANRHRRVHRIHLLISFFDIRHFYHVHIFILTRLSAVRNIS